MKKKILFSLLLVSSISVLLPSFVFAFDFSSIFVDFVVAPIHSMISDILTQAFKGVTEIVAADTDIEGKLKRFNVMFLLDMSRTAAFTFAFIYFLFQLAAYLKDQAAGSGGRTIQSIVFGAITSVALIYSSQWILQDVLIPINNDFVRYIGEQKITIMPDRLMLEVAPLAGYVTIGNLLLMLVILLIIGIGLLILVVVAGLRYAQLVFLSIIGPVLAVSAVNKGAAFNTWLRECVAVVFTQTVHVILLRLLVEFLRGDFFDLLTCIGIIVLMIAGPSVIKPFIHSTGTGGAIVGGTKTAVYRTMMRQAVRR